MAAATITRRRQRGDDVIHQALTILERRLRQPGDSLGSPRAVREYLKLRLGAMEREAFVTLFLDAQNRLIECAVLFLGTINQTSVHPREVVKLALAYNAAGVIFAHNHPSGVTEPSRSDEMLTQAIKSALASFIITVPQSWADVRIENPWVRGTTSTQKATGAFMTIVSSEPAALVAAASPLAGKVEIHETRMDGSVMRMRRVDEIVLPAGRPVDLNPGGYHIMLMELREQLRAGAKIPLTLKFRNGNGAASEVAVIAVVTSVAGEMAKSADHRHH